MIQSCVFSTGHHSTLCYQIIESHHKNCSDSVFARSGPPTTKKQHRKSHRRIAPEKQPQKYFSAPFARGKHTLKNFPARFARENLTQKKFVPARFARGNNFSARFAREKLAQKSFFPARFARGNNSFRSRKTYPKKNFPARFARGNNFSARFARGKSYPKKIFPRALRAREQILVLCIIFVLCSRANTIQK